MSFKSLSLALQQVQEFQDVMELVEHDNDDLMGLDQRRDIVIAAKPHSAVNTSTIHPEKPSIPRVLCCSVANQEGVSAADMVRRARSVFKRDPMVDPTDLSW
jgi:hypothetical protein